MLLKPFEASRYCDQSIVVGNPANGKQELFSDRECAILNFLKENETQSLLALLMPNIGIAKKSHIVMCLSVLKKLKRIQVADYYSITGRKPVSDTGTVELPAEKRRIELTSLDALAATVYALATKLLAPLGEGILLGITFGLAVAGFAFFPFAAAAAAFRDGSAFSSYSLLFLVAYLSGCGAFCLRALLQAAFLRGVGREVRNPVFAIYFPFLSLSAERRAVNMLGHRARARMAALGIAAPFALVSLFTVLAATNLMGAALAFTGLSACFAIGLILACPFQPFDGADFLQAFLFQGQLEETVSTRIKGVLHSRGSLDRELVFALFLSLAWLVAWLDGLYSFQGMIAPRIVEDFTRGSGSAKFGAAFTAAFLALVALIPAGIFFAHHLRIRAMRARKRMVVQADKVKDSLTFEERIAALERIPLFTCLKDQERLALLNEMQPTFFRHGDYLVHQKEVGREFYVLVKGHANATYTDMNGKVFSLADLAEGDAFGEIALIDDVPRTASVISDGGCIALVLRKAAFERFSESFGSTDRVKAMIRLTSFFRRHPLFSKLSPRDQAQLIESFRFQTITSGEEISAQDDNFYVIYSGRVRVDTGGSDGETDLSSDDCFGYSNPLHARFTALEGTGLLSIAKSQFERLIWEKLVEKPELFV
jgi:CRP-like cAMP-binding protein